MNNAAEFAASYQVMEPSDSAMNKNVLFYKSQMKVPEDKLVPRQVYFYVFSSVVYTYVESSVLKSHVSRCPIAM